MRIRPFILLFLSLFVHFICQAQTQAQTANESLPDFKQDPSFKQGRLPNDMYYYFASNKTYKGRFNLSLVQKMDDSIPEASLDSIAAESLTKVNSLSYPVRDLLSRNGIAPGPKGYYTIQRGSICYNFNGLSSAFNERVIDSTLMAVFDIAKYHVSLGSVSASQAMVIAGDFDQNTMLSKMRLLSMIIPKAEGKAPQIRYIWDSLATPQSIVTTTMGSLSKVEAIWIEARTPSEYIRSVLPVISNKLAGEFGWVLKRRLEPVFLLNGLNVWTDFKHISSTDGPSDEQIRFTVNCMTKDAPLVEDILQREFQRLLTWGIDAVEYEYARDAYMFDWRKRISRQLIPNAIPQGKCVSAFLYGAPLASDSEQMKFAYREMPLDVQTSLFNNYMRKLLSQNTAVNERLSKVPLLVSRTTIDNIIDRYTSPYALKIPKDKVEPITGGIIWTLSNGINVIYKQMDTKDISYFAYAARGGRTEEDDDLVTTIAGIQPDILENYMAANGMEMSVKMTSTDVRISGNVCKENTELLFKLLVAFSTQAVNKDIFGPDSYKVLVVASDMESSTFSALVSKYAAGLRKSSGWTAGKPIQDDREDIMSQHGYIMYESLFPFDRSAQNKAIADVASYALNDAITQEFCDAGVSARNWSYFPGYPPGQYKLLCGVRRYTGAGLINLKPSEISARLDQAIKKLSEHQVSKAQLDKYKGLAKNSLESFQGTAEFYISIALDRYLDNKNFSSRYNYLVDRVTTADIQNFYAAAANSNR